MLSLKKGSRCSSYARRLKGQRPRDGARGGFGGGPREASRSCQARPEEARGPTSGTAEGGHLGHAAAQRGVHGLRDGEPAGGGVELGREVVGDGGAHIVGHYARARVAAPAVNAATARVDEEQVLEAWRGAWVGGGVRGIHVLV